MTFSFSRREHRMLSKQVSQLPFSRSARLESVGVEIQVGCDRTDESFELNCWFEAATHDDLPHG